MTETARRGGNLYLARAWLGVNADGLGGT